MLFKPKPIPMPEYEPITVGNATYYGCTQIEDAVIVCCQCKNPQATVHRVSHFDFKEHYINNYFCECGNPISVKSMRDPESLMYWTNEEENK